MHVVNKEEIKKKNIINACHEHKINAKRLNVHITNKIDKS